MFCASMMWRKMWRRFGLRMRCGARHDHSHRSSSCGRLAQRLRDRAAYGRGLLRLSLFRGTRGAKVLTGLAIVFLALTLISTLLKLAVIGWIIRSFSVFLAIALVVIFQPELRRALAELGGHPIFSLTSEKREMVHDLAEAVTQLASKQFGALIAIERDTSIRVYEETGVQLEADFSVELLLTIFHPKTALHDGGVIVRNGRVAAAACIFPVSQRETLDRSLGLRHRAGLGLTEESDAVAVVVSEET